MDDKDRTPEEKPERRVPRRDQGQDDEFASIIDGAGQEPLEYHDEVSPIDPLEDVDVIDGPKYWCVREAIEARSRGREAKEKDD